MAKLVIKYQGDYIVGDNNKKYSLIDVPIYSLMEDEPNISLFIMFLCGGILDEKYGSSKAITEYEGMCLNACKFGFSQPLLPTQKGSFLTFVCFGQRKL